jgi:MFS family permease
MHYGWIITFASLVVGVCGYGTYFSFTLFYSHLAAEFAWSHTAISGAMSLGLVAYGLFALPMGWCADRFGPRITVIVGGILFGTGTSLGAFVTEVWHLYALYGGIAAAGMGAAWAPLVSTVSRWFVKRRGLAAGIATLGGGSGIFFVAPVADALIVNLGWRDAYLWLGLISGGLIIISALFLTQDPALKGMRPYGAEEETSASIKPKSEPARRDFWFIRTWLFWRMVGTVGMWWFAGSIVYVQIAPYLLEKGFAGPFVATLVTALGAGSCIGRVIMGLACDRIGGQRAYQISITVSLLAMVALVAVDAPTPSLFVLFALGYGIGGTSTQITTMSVELFGTASVGALLGTVMACVGAIGAGGPVVAGMIHDTGHSYAPAYLMGAVVFGVSLLATVSLNRPSSEEFR